MIRLFIRPRRPAFVMIDMIVGLAILSAMAAILAAMVGQQRSASARLSNRRVAARLAERTLVELYQGHPAPPDPQNGHISVAPAEGGTRVGQNSWVQVNVRIERENVALVGLAKAPAEGRP